MLSCVPVLSAAVHRLPREGLRRLPFKVPNESVATANCFAHASAAAHCLHCCLHADLLVSDSTRLWKPCDDLPPCEKYIWSYGDWVCDNAKGCGGGTAGRNISCVVSSSGKVVADSRCTSPPDNTTQPCATPKCIDYYWKAKELADCMPEDATKPCGRVRCWLMGSLLVEHSATFYVD
jgi:hypothetical protein